MGGVVEGCSLATGRLWRLRIYTHVYVEAALSRRQLESGGGERILAHVDISTVTL